MEKEMGKGLRKKFDDSKSLHGFTCPLEAFSVFEFIPKERR
jgi:hypothetical protein